ncbi:MAG: hypothetical protein ACK4UN_01465 [Limisphaerales bacterium]
MSKVDRNSGDKRGNRGVFLAALVLLIALSVFFLKRAPSSSSIKPEKRQDTEQSENSRLAFSIPSTSADENEPSADSQQRAASRPAPISPAGAPIEIFGRVVLKGEPPEERVIYELRRSDGSTKVVKSRDYEVSPSGGLANAFVYVKSGLEKHSFPAPAKPLLLEQKDFFLHPFMVGVQVDQPIHIDNTARGESIQHSYRLRSGNGSEHRWAKDNLLELVFSEPEVFHHVTCPIHPWEWAYFGVLTHPYFAVTDKEGYFRLPKGIPPGKYTIEVAHPKAGQTRRSFEAMQGMKHNFAFTLQVPRAEKLSPPIAPVVENEDAPLEEIGTRIGTVAAGATGTVSNGAPIGESWSSSGTIRGKVILHGTPPPERPIDALKNDLGCGKLVPVAPSTRFYVIGEENGLADTVVYLELEPEQQKLLPQRSEPLLIDQVNCEYIPYVAAVQTGQKVLVRNSDPLFHNVHTTPTASGNREMNKAQMPKAPDLEFVFQAPEPFLRFKCDVHPWMFSYVSVFDHPYFAVTDKNGNFSITNIPPGKYTLHAQHRRAGAGSAPAAVQIGRESQVLININAK